jgi:hypothetical protein
VQPVNNVPPKNLTPNPFPRGKGSKRRRGPLPLLPIIRFPFPARARKKGSGVRFPGRKGRSEPNDRDGPPTHSGKGLGVRFFICSTLLLAFAGCAQVHEKMFTLDCAIGRAPLDGELAPGSAMAFDVSTSPVPLLFAPHRLVARCDDAGVVTMTIETPVDTGLSQLTTPLSTAASHVTYAP